jgi:hypothetical protein
MVRCVPGRAPQERNLTEPFAGKYLKEHSID